MHLICYTCVTNNYDWLLPPLWRSPNVRYICFTDNPRIQVEGWETRPIPSAPGLDNGTLANRYCKFFPWEILPRHDWSLYIDANVRVINDPAQVIEETKRNGAEIAIPRHPKRTDIWQEADARKRLEKIRQEDLYKLEAQLSRYRREGLPQDIGLTENNIIFRSGDATRLLPVMQGWWEELQKGVQRDQIGLPYMLWKTGTPVYRLPYSARDFNPYFPIVPHRRSGSLSNYIKARRYHGTAWKALFHSGRIASAAKRQLTSLHRSTSQKRNK